MKKKALSAMLILALLVSLGTAGVFSASAGAVRKENPYMRQLDIPTEEQYAYKDWKQTTVDFLNYVLDSSNVYDEKGTNKKIARLSPARNVDAYFGETGNQAWSIPPYIGKGDDATLGEGITVIAAVMSGALVGMDMTDYPYDGQRINLVKSCVEYFQAANAENVILNGGAGGTTGKTFWYELLPGVLFSVLAEQYPSEAAYTYDIVTESARRWFEAVEGMGGASADFYHTAYNLSTGTPYDNGSWSEPDAAAGIAYLLYAAYSLNTLEGTNAYATDEEIADFRKGALWSMDYLERIEFSPFYEVLTFLAPYLAARMNATEGTNYNVAKMLAWTLDGSSEVRGGWGMVTENWGGRYTEGLMGSLTDGGGYAFAMNTFDAMLGFAPMVKYDTRFAADISKWVLCVSVGAQQYYPEQYDLTGEYKTYGGNTVWHGYTQSGRWIKPDDPAASFIPYEGLRKHRRYVTYNDAGVRGTAWDNARSPYASGDAFTFDWGGDTDYGLYGGAHVGLFGATISDTNVPMILRTDLNALDVYNGSGDIGFYMYYNPHDTAKSVEIELTAAGNRLYDTITKSYLPLTPIADNRASFSLPAGQTVVAAELPSEGEVIKTGARYTFGGAFIAQDRGSVDLSLYDGAGNAVSAGQSVGGNVSAALSVSLPEDAAVESVRLTCAGVTLYEGKTAPAERLTIDTTKLRNGAAVMTAALTLSGGVVEKSTLNLRIMNVVKTPAVEYDGPEDMAEKWNAATTEWAGLYPKSAHNATAAAKGGGLEVTAGQNHNFGFATSELFYMDFSRAPMLELEITGASAQYAIKVYADGMAEPTGVYVVEDANRLGKIELDLYAEMRKADRSFAREGAHLASIKIAATGAPGASVAFKDFNVYHMYTTPVLDEPDYAWNFSFTSVWMSLWNAEIGSPVFGYNDRGESVVTGGGGRNGVASPYITTDLSQNPIFEVKPLSLTGAYFAGVRFEGDPKLYVLADNVKSADPMEVEIVSAMRRLYPDDKKSGVVKLRVVVGTASAGELKFGSIETYYKLPGWGAEVRGDGWLDWEKQTGVTALGSLTLDASGNAFIRNEDPASVQTSVAGMRGKFTVNFDRNPEVGVVVRNVSGEGQWRLTLTPFGSAVTYELIGWSRSAGRQPFTANVGRAVDYALTGSASVYLNLEIRGGGTSVRVDSVTTGYVLLPPVWGETYTREIAAWNRGADPSAVKVNGSGSVTISESVPDSTGLFSPETEAAASYFPVITVDVAAVTGNWYLKAEVAGQTFALTPEKGSADTGKTAFDVRKAVGIPIGSPFTAVYEIGGTGEAFSVTVASVSFAYRLDAVSEARYNESDNTVTFTLPEGASGSSYVVRDAAGETVRTGTAGAVVDLTPLGLNTGVYNLYISATGDRFLPSDPVRRAFKQGDVPSVALAAPSGYRPAGTRIAWNEVENAAGYAYTLTDEDNDETIAEGETAEPFLDLAAIGLDAFNHRLTVKTLGDDVVYLTSGQSEFSFYTAVAARYAPKAFVTMISTNNGCFAAYDETAGAAVLQVPNSGNWGNVASPAFELDFDSNPLLELKFEAEGSAGGYYLQISVDGTTYYLMDNTFDFADLVLDLAGTLAKREDGPGQAPTGKRTVKILFGATGGTLTDSPIVRIKSARVVEMTEGSGTPYLGELAKPAITVDGTVVKWKAVEHAAEYALVVKNEFGALITTTVVGTEYDCSILKREGDYTVEVTARGPNYYDSETATAVLTVTAKKADGGCGCGSSALGGLVWPGLLCAAGFAALALKRRVKR